MSGLDVGPLREQLRPARRDRSAGKLANGRRTPKSAVPSPRPATSTQRSYSSPASVAHARVKAAAATPTQVQMTPHAPTSRLPHLSHTDTPHTNCLACDQPIADNRTAVALPVHGCPVDV